MAKILFLIPKAILTSEDQGAIDEEIMTPEAQEALSINYPDIEVVQYHPKDVIEIVQGRISQGFEIVAARTVTAFKLRQAKLNIAVVTIPITSFDVIRAINKAKLQGKRIAVIAHTTMVLGIDYLAEMLNVEIRHYVTRMGQNYEEAVQEAISDGAEVILGGAMAGAAAKSYSMPYSPIKIGEESLLQAAQEARHIQVALESESAKRGFLRTILDYTNDGIITVDKDHNITAFNPVAQKLTNVDKLDALGQPIEIILPQINLENTDDKGKETPHHIIVVNGNKVICNCVPININGKAYGAVVTLQEISKIQQIEAVIRKEIYARGHIAHFKFKDIIGKSPAIIEAIETAKDFAATNSSVLIMGKTGTGKEVFAQSIHNASKRSQKPFVAINCASLPSQLLESELFGYVAGAFTGASKDGKPGLFEVAHGGTIFLDELSEMDYTNQGRLLRVLQEKTVVRLGSYRVIPVDIRVIAATNKDLDMLVRENKFRDDLYFRLNVLRLELPSLEARKEDIRLYAESFLHNFSSEMGKKFKLTRDALQFLENNSWPGNIRECQNLMERVAATAKTNLIDSALLARMLKHKPQKALSRSPKEDRLIREINKALDAASGNQTTAAEMLGINRTTLYRRMQRFNIEY